MLVLQKTNNLKMKNKNLVFKECSAKISNAKYIYAQAKSAPMKRKIVSKTKIH